MNMGKRLIGLLLIPIMITSLFAGCGGASSTTPGNTSQQPASAQGGSVPTQAEQGLSDGSTGGDTVKIGLFACLSGNNADSGKIVRQGVELATKLVNENGGLENLGGAKIELVVTDITSDSTQVAAIVERVLSQNPDMACGLGFSTSGVTLAAISVFENYKMPFFTCGTNNDITTKGYNYVFRNVCNGTAFSDIQLEFIRYLQNAGYGGTKLGIVYENTAYGISMAESAEAKFSNADGLELALYESFSPGFSDASSLVTKLKNAGCDIVIPCAYANECSLIMSTMAQMNYSPIVVGGGAGMLLPSFGVDMGESVNGITSASCWNFDSTNITNSAACTAAVKQYEETYGDFMAEHAGLTFSHLVAAAEAINYAGSTDHEEIRKAIIEMTPEWELNLINPPGYWDFDEKGDNINAIALIVQWQDGRPRTVYPLEYAGAELMQ